MVYEAMVANEAYYKGYSIAQVIWMRGKIWSFASVKEQKDSARFGESVNIVSWTHSLQVELRSGYDLNFERVQCDGFKMALHLQH